MFKKAVFPGKYIQGAGAIGELPALVELPGKQGLMLASPSVNERVLPRCGVDWRHFFPKTQRLSYSSSRLDN